MVLGEDGWVTGEQWSQMRLNGSNGHREGKAPEMPQAEQGSRADKLRAWRLQRERLSGSYQLGCGTLQSNLHLVPDFLHPSNKPLQESVLPPKMQVFTEREPSGKLAFSIPSPSNPRLQLRT